MTFTELGIKAGNRYVKLCRIVENPNSIYFVLCFPKLGLHLSLHRPSFGFRNFHAHVKSELLGIHEDIDLDDDLVSIDFWNSRIQEFVDRALDWGNPTLGDESVLIIPYMTRMFSSFEGRGRHAVDLGCMLKGPFIITEVVKMPELLNKLPSIDPSIPHQDILMGIKYPGYNILVIDRNGCSIEVDYSKVLEMFRFKELEESFASALKAATNTIEDMKPNVLKRWIPKTFIDDLRDDFHHLQPCFFRF